MKRTLRWLSMMESSHIRYFATYFAQGVGRVGKDYLKSLATTVLAGDKGSMQLFFSLLPEFGSLPWTLKPVFVFLIERSLGAVAQNLLVVLLATSVGVLWLLLEYVQLSATTFLACTGLISLGAALVDGLCDGCVSAESTDAESASKLQYICQSGTTAGSLYVGLIVWALSISKSVSIHLTALSWMLIAPVTMYSLVTPSPLRHRASDAKASESEKTQHTGIDKLSAFFASTANSGIPLVTVLSFLACLSPSIDTFLFRKQVLKLADSQQPLVTLAGTFGWFLGTSFYRMHLSKGRSPDAALRLCLLIWPFSLLATACLAWFPAWFPSAPSLFVLAAAAFENASTEFGKAMTFMPTTVLQQLHATAGCEGTTFTLMQSGGTLGMVLSRNLEWYLMSLFLVEPQLGALGFANFHAVALAALAWRCTTAALLLTLLVPVLKRESTHECSE